MFQLSQLAKNLNLKKKTKRQHINGKVLVLFFTCTENDLITNYFSHVAYMSITWGPSQNIWERPQIQI